MYQVVHLCRPLGGAARQAFGSFVRAYATHSVDTKGIFKVRPSQISQSNQAFGSFVRAYATHSVDTKGIFKVRPSQISQSSYDSPIYFIRLTHSMYVKCTSPCIWACANTSPPPSPHPILNFPLSLCLFVYYPGAIATSGSCGEILRTQRKPQNHPC